MNKSKTNAKSDIKTPSKVEAKSPPKAEVKGTGKPDPKYAPPAPVAPSAPAKTISPSKAPAPAKASFDTRNYAKNGVSEEEVSAIKHAFDLFDSDQGGSIDIKGTYPFIKN